MNTKHKKGFTLIEILVVSTIIAVLIAIGTVSYTSVNQKSRNTKRKSDVEQIRSALEMYRADNGIYIVGSGAGSTTLSGLESNGYITKIPVDPKSAEYGYTGTNCPDVSTCYGYTLQSTLEGYAVGVFPAENTCTPTGSYNYCIKNP